MFVRNISIFNILLEHNTFSGSCLFSFSLSFNMAASPSVNINLSAKIDLNLSISLLLSSGTGTIVEVTAGDSNPTPIFVGSTESLAEAS